MRKREEMDPALSAMGNERVDGPTHLRRAESSLAGMVRRSILYVDKILKGAST
jgi:hypothetical protein